MSGGLIQIPRHEWCKLRDLYGEQRAFASSYNLLHTIIEWLSLSEYIEVEIYGFGTEWTKDGTFILQFRNSIYCNTLSNNGERLRDALNLLDTKKEYYISAFPERLLNTIMQYFMDIGLHEAHFKPVCTVWYHLPQKVALAFIILPPENIYLKQLEGNHAKKVNSIWPHRSPDSENFVKDLIKYNTSVGAFVKNDDNLIAWCLTLPLGSLGLLQVIEDYKRQGIGSLLVRYMSKMIAERNLEVTAPVIVENIASRSLFEKLGFKVIDKAYWVHQQSTNK